MDATMKSSSTTSTVSSAGSGIRVLVGGGKTRGEDGAAVIVHRHRAAAGLGGVSPVEDVADPVGCDARPGVCDVDQRDRTIGGEAYVDARVVAARGRVDRVVD